MSQTQAPKVNMDEGRPGLAAEPFGPEDIRSLVNPSGRMYFGHAAARGSSYGQTKLPTASDDVIEGVVMASHALESQDNSEEPNYPAQKSSNVMRKGYIWAKIEEDIALGDDVYFRYGKVDQVHTIAFDADFVTGNSVSVVVNGETVTQAFDTNHDDTMAALVAQILTVPGVQSVSSNTGGDNRTITVTSDTDADIVIGTPSVTGGASQASGVTTETVEPKTAKDLGKFRNDADSSTAAQLSNARWVKGGTAALGYALLELDKL